MRMGELLRAGMLGIAQLGAGPEWCHQTRPSGRISREYRSQKTCSPGFFGRIGSWRLAEGLTRCAWASSCGQVCLESPNSALGPSGATRRAHRAVYRVNIGPKKLAPRDFSAALGVGGSPRGSPDAHGRALAGRYAWIHPTRHRPRLVPGGAPTASGPPGARRCNTARSGGTVARLEITQTGTSLPDAPCDADAGTYLWQPPTPHWRWIGAAESSAAPIG